VSVEAVAWALNHAPVDQAPAAAVLVGLANHAGPDGRNAFPSVATLVRYTRLAERTVREQLDILHAAGIITPCDPDVVAAHVKRADRRPNGWDIDQSLDRDNPEHLERFQRAAAAHKDRKRHRRLNSAEPDEVRTVHPVDEVHVVHPAPSTGCTVRRNGVHLAPERGAPRAPELYLNHPGTAPARAHVRASAPAASRAEGGGGNEIAEFFTALGEAWPLSAGQRDRLGSHVAAALDAGWSTNALADHVGGNTDGIRNPYAVLRSRLSDIPDPPEGSQRPAERPPWCGRCEEATRLFERPDGRLSRCPDCHPLSGDASSSAAYDASTMTPAQSASNDGHVARAIAEIRGQLRALPPAATAASTGADEG
jgi:hypothetical protein